MSSLLKNHPFAVEAFFERSLVLTFAVAKEELEPLIPECLTLDTFDDKWAFIAVAMVQTTGLRPKGFPKIFGSDFLTTTINLDVGNSIMIGTTPGELLYPLRVNTILNQNEGLNIWKLYSWSGYFS